MPRAPPPTLTRLLPLFIEIRWRVCGKCIGRIFEQFKPHEATLSMFRCRFPPLLYPFLDNKELTALSSMNRELEKETRIIRKKRKTIVASRVIQDFYLKHFKLISIHRMHDSRQLIRHFFTFLPELGAFLTEKDVIRLDLSPPLSEYFSPEECREILIQLYGVIRENRTLTYCNLRGFEQYMSWKESAALLSNHPTLSMEHPIATHFCFYQRRI